MTKQFIFHTQYFQTKMIRIFPLLITICLSIQVFSQTNPLLQVESYQLPNGLTVFLNEDTTATKVFGAVMVNAGSKNEDPTATGMAHYLEHMLFKGTEEMGTWDYASEKPHLDSVNLLYEQLAVAKDESAKANIQQAINEQAVKASEYGLPNEFDKLLKSIGSTEVNAFTSYEMTFYHNYFPAHEIDKWLDIYAERFENPVFRSFQSELEVVYEEKNRAEDSFERRVYEKMQELIFPNLPYGQWSVLGTTDHLKNPSLTKMYDFYDKQYVPGNMALILTGNFDKESAKRSIKEKFGDWEAKEVPVTRLPEPKPIVEEQLEKVRITPIKAGFLGFQTVPYNHPDRIAMDVAEYLLYNEGETGYINQIELNNEMIYAGSFSSIYNDAGAYVIFFIPKILVQSIGNAEKKIENALNNLHFGEFSDELLQAAKNEISRTYQESLENLEERGTLIGGSFNAGLTWDYVLQYPSNIQNITKEDVIRVSNKYLGKNLVKMVSRTGFPKKEKLDKPPYKPVTSEQEKESAYAKEFEKIEAKDFEPQFLDLTNDVDRIELPGGHTIMTSKNSFNNIFNLEIKFRTGTIDNPKLDYVAGIGTLSGAGNYSMSELKNAYAALGSTYDVYGSLNYFVVTLEGPEDKLDETLKLTNLLLTDIKPNENTMKVLYNGEKTERKLEKRTPQSLSMALINYASYGDQSYYLERLKSKEIKALEAEDLQTDFLNILKNYQAEIVYTGKKSAQELSELVADNLDLSASGKAMELQVRPMQPVSKPQILFVNNKKAVQSQVYFYMPGEPVAKDEYPYVQAFNQYFGGGFSGLILQEIREYRSLAYSAAGWYQPAPITDADSRLITYIGCQADKTTDAITVMKGLIEDMPQKPERMAALRKNLQLETVTEYPDFRSIPDRVIALERRGFDDDPNRTAYETYPELTMEDIYEFYAQRIKGKPYTITVLGDGRRINMDELKKLGEVVELKYDDFINK